MTAKYQNVLNALQAAERCVAVCVNSVVAYPDAFTFAWNASRDALNEERLPAEARDIIRQIALNVLLNMTDARRLAQSDARDEVRRAQDAAREEVKLAQDAAREEVKRAQDAASEEVKRAQDAAREEVKRAVETAVKERKELERRAVALFLCAVVGTGLFFTPWQVASAFPLACALCVLKFRLPIKSLADWRRFARFGEKPE